MKTAEELFFKWRGEQCTCGVICGCKTLNIYGLHKALIEHNKEIIQELKLRRAKATNFMRQEELDSLIKYLEKL